MRLLLPQRNCWMRIQNVRSSGAAKYAQTCLPIDPKLRNDGIRGTVKRLAITLGKSFVETSAEKNLAICLQSTIT